jgi:hypothetical protein
VISEATGLPYKEDYFRHEFRRIANMARLDFQFRDLRRGGLTETADAGVQPHLVASDRDLLPIREARGRVRDSGWPVYRFPTLAECRRRFAEDFGQSLDHLWGDAQEDWDTEDEPTESYPIGKRW